ncbi:MAG: Na+/H+ antiporter NhaA [Solirubrobacterales bacterium]|nr:Na+/H+ antiporter NhaA [Solirubrobacterales bacterium]
MGDAATPGDAVRKLSGHTAWTRNIAAPLRNYLDTEVSGAFVLLAASLVALIWANVASGSYESFWNTDLSISLGLRTLGGDLHYWVNDGLMTFFFLVVGLEVRREFDMGELRERRRVAIPVLAAVGGMALPAAIYLAFNAGGPNAEGWGIVMPTDTAFALGMLALFGRRVPVRLRVFVLTLVIADDIGTLLVIAVAYSSDISLDALAVTGLLALLAVGIRRFWNPLSKRPYEAIGIAVWIAMAQSGVHPTIAGVIIGLAISAKPPVRQDLERATAIARLFREQPTAELARSAKLYVQNAVSENERLQFGLHPWTSFLIVPIFALANAGVTLSSELLKDAATSPVTIGIISALVFGKLFGIGLTTMVAAHPRLGRLPLPVEIPPVFGAAALCGIGFTLSLFIAGIAFEGRTLDEAKVGILVAAVVSTALGAVLIAITNRMAASGRKSSVTPSSLLEDLAKPVDFDRDHIRGPRGARVTLLEYGDYECIYCGRAENTVRELLERFDDELTYVWRHLPLQDIHPRAQLASEAAEVAAAQGRFWEMHDLMIGHQSDIEIPDLRRYAKEIGLDLDRFWEDLRSRDFAERVAEDVESADESLVTGTPSFFINGRRHEGAYDIDTLTAKVRKILGSDPVQPD